MAASDWWRTADPIEMALVDALRWIGPLTAADLTRVFGGAVHPVALLNRLKRMVSEGPVEVVDARRVRGVMVRRYRATVELT